MGLANTWNRDGSTHAVVLSCVKLFLTGSKGMKDHIVPSF